MAILIEGIGDDWVVTRRPGGKPELSTFSTLSELKRVMTRLLLKYGQAPVAIPAPAPVVPKVLPTVEPPPPEEPKVAMGDFGTLPPGTDCRDCGACCSTMDDSKTTHVKLEPGDVNQIPAALRGGLVKKEADGFYMKTKKNQEGVTVCAALSGSVGSKCKCGIYNQRPLICRLFEPGSLECLIARKVRGL